VRDNIDAPPEKFFQFVSEPSEVKERATGLKRYQEIDIARLRSTFPCDRAKYADINGTISRCYLQYLSFFLLEQLFEVHEPPPHSSYFALGKG